MLFVKYKTLLNNKSGVFAQIDFKTDQNILKYDFYGI